MFLLSSALMSHSLSNLANNQQQQHRHKFLKKKLIIINKQIRHASLPTIIFRHSHLLIERTCKCKHTHTTQKSLWSFNSFTRTILSASPIRGRNSVSLIALSIRHLFNTDAFTDTIYLGFDRHHNGQCVLIIWLHVVEYWENMLRNTKMTLLAGDRKFSNPGGPSCCEVTVGPSFSQNRFFYSYFI